jgi:ADP-ribose pyrophosphatase
MDDGRWRTVAQNYLFSNPWCAFRVDDVELPDGKNIEYGVLESGGFAAVIPVTENGDVVFVRQWRQPLGAFTLELPSGGVGEGEDLADAAQRELLEETGYRARELEYLISVHTSTGRSTELCHLYRCRAVRDTGGAMPENTEFIEVVELPFEESLDLVRGGIITDVVTVMGLLLTEGFASGGSQVH